MAYELPPLPYSNDALEPHIDARTMEIHHDQHHNAYVTNLNAALEGVDVGGKTIEELIADLDSLPEEQAHRRAQQRGRTRQPFAVLDGAQRLRRRRSRR